MKRKVKWVIRILLSASIIGALFSGLAMAKTAYGDVIGDYGGAEAHSNGPCTARYNGVFERTDCSLSENRAYQSDEYARRFYQNAMGMDTSGWSGYGGSYYETASGKGLGAYPNGGSVPPQPDDILALSGGREDYGHVAIITEIGNDYVKVIEQNWARDRARDKIKYDPSSNLIGDDVTGGKGYRARYLIQGWLRKPGIHIVGQSILCNNNPCSSTNTVMPNEEITLVFKIDNPNSYPLECCATLSAQIRTTNPANKWRRGSWNNNWIDLPGENKVIRLLTGIHDYTVKFRIPASTEFGTYDIKWVLRDGNLIGSKALDSAFEIKYSRSITPTITVLLPENGQTWNPRDPTCCKVQWTSTNSLGKIVDIALLQNGVTVPGVGTTLPIDAGAATLDIPDTVRGENYQIRISRTDRPRISDVSDGYFTIGIPGFSKVFGTAGQDDGYSAIETRDGDFVEAGTIKGTGGTDALIVKTASNGYRLWEYPYGGSGKDNANALAETLDGGYLVVGSTQSFPDPGKEKGWIFKVKSDGTLDWEKTLVGPNASDYTTNGFTSVERLSDGGFILSGYTSSHDSSYYRNDMQTWLVRLDKDGNVLWSYGYGTSGYYDYSGVSAQELLGGNIIMAVRSGHPFSWGVTVSQDGEDLNWKGFTEPNVLDYVATDVEATLDGGYVIIGRKRIGYNAMTWLYKVDSSGIASLPQTYQESNVHIVMNSISETLSGELAMAGYREPTDTYVQKGLVIKTDTSGTEEGRKISSETNENVFNSIKGTRDKGYILAGSTWPPESTNHDIWLLKTDETATI